MLIAGILFLGGVDNNSLFDCSESVPLMTCIIVFYPGFGEETGSTWAFSHLERIMYVSWHFHCVSEPTRLMPRQTGHYKH